jgi:hypothetical protein
MRVSTWLRRLVNPRRTDPRSSEVLRRESVDRDTDRRLAIERADARRSGALDIPRDRHDSGDWDRYWRNQLKAGVFEQGFSDMMSSDPTLPAFFRSRGVRTVLCAGNGMSSEAVALALHGFAVTALDVSQLPAEVYRFSFAQPDNPFCQLPNFRVHEDGTVSFGTWESIDRKLCPRIHFSDEDVPRPGGSVLFVTGNLFDGQQCPGLYDAVIERRVLQLFPEADQARGLERLVARLVDGGVFVSQQHYGGWRPGEPRQHFAEGWLTAHGFQIESVRRSTAESVPRIARLIFTTG